MIEYLKKCLSELNIEISDYQLNQFQIFYDLLIEKNKVMNLTAITEEKEVVLKHFVDSVLLLKYIEIDHSSIIDVGTGAGFPGIPLAIMCPDSEFMLLDALNKRINFLKEVVENCKLENVNLIHARAEELGHDKMFREKYDFCISRAVSNLSALLEYSSPFVKKKGKVITYKSEKIQEELDESSNAQKILSCKLDDVISFKLPDGNTGRSFLIFEKEELTPVKYPRNAAKMKKKSL